MQCIDASVAVKWIFPEEHSAQAVALARDCNARGEPLIAPPLLPMETANVIRQRMRRGGLSLSEAREAFDLFRAAGVFTAPDTADANRIDYRALELADRFGLPAVYDAYYLAVADLAACPLWTADRRLLSAVGGRLPNVRFIGEYTA